MKNTVKNALIKEIIIKPINLPCKCHDKNGRCSNLSAIDGPSYYTADNWFCWQADPKNKE